MRLSNRAPNHRHRQRQIQPQHLAVVLLHHRAHRHHHHRPAIIPRQTTAAAGPHRPMVVHNKTAALINQAAISQITRIIKIKTPRQIAAIKEAPATVQIKIPTLINRQIATNREITKIKARPIPIILEATNRPEPVIKVLDLPIIKGPAQVTPTIINHPDQTARTLILVAPTVMNHQMRIVIKAVVIQVTQIKAARVLQTTVAQIQTAIPTIRVAINLPDRAIKVLVPITQIIINRLDQAIRIITLAIPTTISQQLIRVPAALITQIKNNLVQAHLATITKAAAPQINLQALSNLVQILVRTVVPPVLLDLPRHQLQHARKKVL